MLLAKAMLTYTSKAILYVIVGIIAIQNFYYEAELGRQSGRIDKIERTVFTDDND